MENMMQRTFEDIKKIGGNGQEYWSARRLMPMLGYRSWQNFEHIIHKAMSAAKNSRGDVSLDFINVNRIYKSRNKYGEMERRTKDYDLSRYACYLIAQNGDPEKPEIALAQSYFAHQTRRQEMYQHNLKLMERLRAREKLRGTERKFTRILTDHGVIGKDIGEIRSKGDETLFGSPTNVMKNKLGISQSEPLADYLPTITLKAKDLAAEITSFQTEKKNLGGKDAIAHEHIHNNEEIRKLLTSNGIFPEELAPEEDIKKLGRLIQETPEAFGLTAPPVITPKQSETHTTTLPEISEIKIDITGVFSRQVLTSLAKLIESNPGATTLKVFYGKEGERKMIKRKIALTVAVFQELEPYVF